LAASSPHGYDELCEELRGVENFHLDGLAALVVVDDQLIR